MKLTKCVVCGSECEYQRSTKMTCSDACRAKIYRERSKLTNAFHEVTLQIDDLQTLASINNELESIKNQIMGNQSC